MTLLLEHWKPVAGWEGLYSITNTGRLYSHRAGKMLRPNNRRGYRFYTLSRNNKKKNYFEHALVAEAFIKPRPDKLTINHLDGFKRNSRPSNLEYVTHAKNKAHAVAHGLTNYGVKNGRAKIDDSIAMAIRKNPLRLPPRQLASQHGIHKSTVYRIINGQLWNRVT